MQANPIRSIGPGEHDADVAGRAAREIDDLVFDTVATGFEVIGPELEDL
jgi:hypothetical protein